MRIIPEFIYRRFGFLVPYIRIIDILQILLITFVIFKALVWMRNTKAWNLLKGIFFILIFYVIAVIFNMSVITWLVNASVGALITAFIIIFQPEIRQVLEKLGSNVGGKGDGFLTSLIPIELRSRIDTDLFNKQTVMEILNAVFAMAPVRTGALIVIQNTMPLRHYVQRWGTDIDAIVGSELLINIFEKDTPLHDGAVIIIGNRIAAAKCFLPLNETESISSNLGTRHHAAAGISEVTDSLTIIVSEQTGRVSVARDGRIKLNLDRKGLERELLDLCPKENDEENGKTGYRFFNRNENGNQRSQQ
ncbi:MAG: diadenylate cyclase CdaA [Lachnospiraceae bacterium]|nr:diadenylate cyclase CdaA [Lachnospiraceae bacterium]